MSNYFLTWIVYVLIIYFLNSFFLKKNYLKSDTGSKHQLFANNSIPLTGGLFFLFPVFFLYFQIDQILSLCFLLIYLIGLMSDLTFLI